MVGAPLSLGATSHDMSDIWDGKHSTMQVGKDEEDEEGEGNN